MNDEFQGTDQGPLLAQTDLNTDLNRDSVDLALRFLVGLLALGGDEAAWRLQDMQDRLADRFASASNRWGAGRLSQPIRRPIAAQLGQWRKEAARIVREGELEEQQGRALATGALGSLALEVMDEIAENPEMHEFVQDLIGQQGVGMVTSVMDNARSVTLTADDAGEALLRWLLRRKPRRDLPPSPVEGQPQTMYVPTARVEGEAPDAN